MISDKFLDIAKNCAEMGNAELSVDAIDYAFKIRGDARSHFRTYAHYRPFVGLLNEEILEKLVEIKYSSGTKRVNEIIA